MKILIDDILKSDAQTLVNTVNCVGIMGKGIALEFKKRFPEMFEDYAERCKRKEIRPGVPYLYKALFPPQIINFPTKDDWRSLSKISDIERGLRILVERYKEWGVTSLAIPPLGCGNGQLEWKDVGPLMYRHLSQLDIPVEVYAPYGTPTRELTLDFLAHGSPNSPSRTASRKEPSGLNPAWVGLVEIIRRIYAQPYHPPIGRTVFQKIAYVATEEGLPTGLRYQRGSYGPFSKDLKAVGSKLINSNLLQEERVGSMFRVKVGPNYERVRDAYADRLEEWHAVLDKTADLFIRITDTNQAELVSAVLFAEREFERAKRDRPDEVEVLQSVMRWKEKRRPPLKEPDVARTIRDLGILNWLNAKPSADLPLPESDAIPA